MKKYKKQIVIVIFLAIANLLAFNYISNHSYGPKYRYQEDVIEIFVDDYGHYMTVKDATKLKVSTHPNERLYVNGDWEEIINRVYPQVQSLHESETISKTEKERLQLIEKLS